MAMYREGEYAAGASTTKGNQKKAAKQVKKALAKSAATKKAAGKKKMAQSETAGRGFNPTMASKPKGYKAPVKKGSRQS
jgi:hypothetical protein